LDFFNNRSREAKQESAHLQNVQRPAPVIDNATGMAQNFAAGDTAKEATFRQVELSLAMAAMGCGAWSAIRENYFVHKQLPGSRPDF
jgi:hypothetical protein